MSEWDFRSGSCVTIKTFVIGKYPCTDKFGAKKLFQTCQKKELTMGFERLDFGYTLYISPMLFAW